ncbi:MAG: methyltransferase domain-containing protein [Patescibacteria group bacterium]|nr:methyltransferase domain-containing protein [Patescibacteria group bacterium]
MNELYNESLAKEWIDWVEESNPNGTREKEIFTYIKKWANKLNPTCLLDLGCGQGSCSQLINSKIKYIGIDASPTLINRAKQLYSSKNKQFILGDVYDIPLEDNSADAAMSIWVWSHLENLELAAQEMYRVIKTAGHFLLITASPETYEERKTWYKEYSIKGKLLTGIFDLDNGKFLTNTTLYLHSTKEIEGALKKVNFKINHIGEMGRSESSGKGMYLVIEGYK